MLTKEQNELLTRTGPDTPCGTFLRRYWQPVALSEELSADTPIPVRIMSENLALYRGASGKPALLGLRCPHRGADLSYGRIEGEQLRCLYHGWLFAADGRCLDQPSEPPGSTFKERVRQTAYPCEEAGGLIFAYLGPAPVPLMPALPFLSAPDAQVWCTKILHQCNYLQGSEGSFDPQHLSYLHRVQRGAARPDVNAMLAADTAPRIEVEETPFGTRIYTSRSIGANDAFVRVTNFIMPNCAAFGGQQRVDPAVDRRDNDGYQLDWLVPIDDLQFWKYSVSYRYHEPLDKAYLRKSVMGEAEEPYRLRRNAGNRYLQDRAEMAGTTYTGLGVNFAIHDLWAVESQGPVADRTAEHLGASDVAIIAMRRQMLKGIADVEAGLDPVGVRRDRAANPHADVVVWSQRRRSADEVRGFWRRALALGTATLALLLAVTPIRVGADLPPVQIDAILSLTGAGAFFGNATAGMLSVIEDATNKAGGIAGHPLKFVVLDDGSNPQTSVQLANQLVSEKAAAVIGPGLTGTCLAVEPIVAKAGPVSYCTSPSIEPPAGGYMFSAGPPAADTVISSVRYFRERGLKRIAVLTATDASGQAIDRAFEAALKLPENKTVVPVSRQYFNPGDLSVSAQLANIKAANPQAVLVWTAGTPFGTALRGIHEAGLDVPVCTGAGNMTYEQMQQYSQIVPKDLYFSALLGMAPGARVPAAIRTAEAAYYRIYKDAGLRPDGVIAVPWDIALIYIDAFKHLGYGATAEQVRDYIEHLHGFAGFAGIYDFRDGSQRGVGLNTNIIERWDPAQSAFVPASKPGGDP